MTRPFVGPPAATGFIGCTHATALDQPACGAPATVHIIGMAAGWGRVSLPACDAHRLIARAGCTQVVDEHPAADCNGEHHIPA